MPAALMHLEGAERVAASPDLAPSLREAATRVPWCYHLGALLPDLPLFDRFWLKVGLFLLRRPYPESRWGAIIHARGAGALAGALLEAGRERHDLLAVLAGLLTHVALDRVMHAPIEKAVRLHVRPTETRAQLHESIENYQSLQWHRSQHGRDGLGTELVDRIEVAPAGGKRLPTCVAAAIDAALARTYGTPPSSQIVARWAQGLAAYRDLLRGPAASLSVAASERFARERPWVRSVEAQPGLDGGVEDALRYAHAAADALASGDSSVLVRTVGDGPLV